MNRENKTCAMCAHFSVKDIPAKAGMGIGACLGYDTPVEPFVRYDAPFCVLFRRAADVGPRLRFVERQMQHQGEAA